MNVRTNTADSYCGFEQGPIRPPSEARSLLIRITRNCPWNHCTFCPVYKGSKFWLRPVEHVKRDIDAVHRHVETLCEMADRSGELHRREIMRLAAPPSPEEAQAFAAAFHWVFAGGMRSVFLQDANSLVIKPADLVEILSHLKTRFPSIERITSYARAHTIALKKEVDLRAIREAGLNRIHLGLESGSDEVLKRVKKGVTKEKHIIAGCKVKAAGMELSEYVMPGLGGQRLSEIHACETADALNQIDPDFIRIRTLAIPPNAPLYEEYAAGDFDKCTDLMMVKELLTFVERLEGITSVIKSDHILNLFGDLEGTLPGGKERMTGMLRSFLTMEPEEQRLYQVGRRLGMFNGVEDMSKPHKLNAAREACRDLGITADNVDQIIDEVMTRYL